LDFLSLSVYPSSTEGLMRKIVHLLTLTMLFSGCATYDKNEANHFRKYDDIGVLAFFSPNMPVQFNAFSARNKKDVSVDISAWNIDGLLGSELESQLTL